MEDELLTVKEVAARLKANPQTVRRWIRAGKLLARKIISGRYRIEAGELVRHAFALRRR